MLARINHIKKRYEEIIDSLEYKKLQNIVIIFNNVILSNYNIFMSIINNLIRLFSNVMPVPARYSSFECRWAVCGQFIHSFTHSFICLATARYQLVCVCVCT